VRFNNISQGLTSQAFEFSNDPIYTIVLKATQEQQSCHNNMKEQHQLLTILLLYYVIIITRKYQTHHHQYKLPSLNFIA
jgi:hypothetical protein